MKTSYGLPILREEVLEALKNAFSSNHIEEKEYESRVQQALDSQYVEDLRVVLYDFPKPIKDAIFEKNTLSTSPKQTTQELLPSNTVFRSVLSEKKTEIMHIGNSLAAATILGEQKLDLRKADFSVNQLRFDISCYLASTTLDLRNEHLEGKHLDIYVENVLGSIEILIPPTGYISNQVNTTVGEFSLKNKGKSWFNRLFGNNQDLQKETNFSITIHGRCILGEIIVIY